MALAIIIVLAAILGLLLAVEYHRRRARFAGWLVEEWKQRAAFLGRLVSDIEAENEKLKEALEPKTPTPIVVPAGEQVH